MDDDQINIYVLGALLKKKNHRFDSAMNGAQAIEFVSRRINSPHGKMYNLIFLDFSMPDMDGPEVCIEIRKLVKEANL